MRSTERLAATSVPIGALARPGAYLGLVVAVSLLASETVSYRLGLMVPGAPCLLWLSGRDRL